MQEGTTNISHAIGPLFTRVTRKGQVTIPISIRRALHIREGHNVSFGLLRHTLTLTPTTSIVAATAGILRSNRPRLSTRAERRIVEEAIAAEVMERSRKRP